MSDLPPKLAALLAEQGIDATRTYRVLAALSNGQWWTVRDLVRATAVANRTVEAVMVSMEAHLDFDGAHLRLNAAHAAEYRRYARPQPADPVGHLLEEHRDAAALLRELVAEAPPARSDLDHVSASARTALRRGVLLSARFELAGARLLCVGDHDLTSLAATLVNPDAEALVVDIDERMLEYVQRSADRLGLAVRCYYADLRLGLPAAVRDSADLVFTDPPYTPEGVELFVRRGIEGLRAPRAGRLLVAYGASETTPALAAKTQSALAKLSLAFEAIWPDFNSYLGAEAIGAASDLYVLRPTSRTPVTGADDAARIYSQGAGAREAGSGDVGGTAAQVIERSGAETVVGDWPEPVRKSATRHIRLATWLNSPVRAHHVAINLTGGWEAALGRAILASTAETAHIIVAGNTPGVRDEWGQRELAALVAPRYELRFLRGFPDAKRTCVLAHRRPAEPADPADRLLWFCGDRAHGVLANSLREGLIRIAPSYGTRLTKREARDRVAAAAPWLAGNTLLDLPRHRFADLTGAAAEIVKVSGLGEV